MRVFTDFKPVFVVFASMVVVPLIAHAQVQLPPGAQPGATQPRDLTPPIFVPQQPFAFRIPPVLERPLGADEGARVFVRAFELRGILQDPARPGLEAQARAQVEREFREALEVIEAQRIERQRLVEVGDDGFTPDERRRVIDFMSRQISDVSPEQRLADYQRFVDELGLARLERQQGLTIGQIQQIADAVTALYQEAGFFLARAVVPAQDVVDGVVVIQVLEGRLGRALAENNKMYSHEMLVRPFAGLEGQLITTEAINDALLTLSDYPGLQAYGTFRPGSEVGTADIVVNVQDERRFGLAASADNFGTDLTGQYRVAVMLDTNNLFGRGDTATLTMMRTYSPRNTTLGQFTYRLPLDDPRNKVILDLTRNAFDITSEQFGSDFGGLSTNAMIGYERAFARGRHFNGYGQFDFTRKRGESTQLGTLFSRDDLAVVGLQGRWDRIIAESNALVSGYIRLDQGVAGAFGVPASEDVLTPGVLPIPPSRAGADPEFQKLTLGYSRLQQFSELFSMLLRFSGQWSSDVLTSIEQFSVGGANQVRAAPLSVFLGDKGAFGSFEWILNTGPSSTISVFHDHSVAWLNNALVPENAKFSAGGRGIAWSLNLGRFSVTVERAWLVGGDRPGTGPTDPLRIEDSFQTWADVRVRF